MGEVAKNKSMGNFLKLPNTNKFLEENLKENKAEFISNLLTLTDGDDKIKECDPNKLMMCAFNAVSLNLPLNKNLGFAWVIPYSGVPSFQIGYKGLIQLAIRTGKYRFLNACEIKEKEMVRNKITGEIKFVKENPTGKVEGYLAYLELTTGFTASVYMSLDDIEAHAKKYSKMYDADVKNGKRASKWSDPDVRPKMALKTVLKMLLGTYGVMTADMRAAFQTDTGAYENESNFVEAEILPQAEPENKTVDLDKL